MHSHVDRWALLRRCAQGSDVMFCTVYSALCGDGELPDAA